MPGAGKAAEEGDRRGDRTDRVHCWRKGWEELGEEERRGSPEAGRHREEGRGKGAEGPDEQQLG